MQPSKGYYGYKTSNSREADVFELKRWILTYFVKARSIGHRGCWRIATCMQSMEMMTSA